MKRVETLYKKIFLGGYWSDQSLITILNKVIGICGNRSLITCKRASSLTNYSGISDYWSIQLLVLFLLQICIVQCFGESPF